MFEQLIQDKNKLSQQFPFTFESQIKICSQYIKIASEKLYEKQAAIISQANFLLEKLSAQERKKDLSDWDVFSTRDSMAADEEDSINLSQISKRGVITRRSVFASKSSKEIDDSLVESIQEIQKQCSSKTVNIIKKIVEEYKKIKSKIQQTQKKQKNLKIKEKAYEQFQEKNIILTQKINDLESENTRVKSECGMMKLKIKELNEAIDKKINEMNSIKSVKVYEEIAINSKNLKLQTLNRYMDEKQKQVNSRLERIKRIEENIENNLLFKQNNNQQCEKCCTILKKIKTSVFSYKQYLQSEGKQIDALIDEFKDQIFNGLTE